MYNLVDKMVLTVSEGGLKINPEISLILTHQGHQKAGLLLDLDKVRVKQCSKKRYAPNPLF